MAQYRNVTEFLTKIRETYNKAREEYTLLNDRLDKIEALRVRDIKRGWANPQFQKEDTETYQKNKAEIKKQLSELINNTNAEYEKIKAECEAVFGEYDRSTGKKVDLATVELLKSGILRPDEIKALINDFNGNSAMLRIIGDYAYKRGKEEKDKQPDPCVQAFLQDQLSDPRMHLLVQGDTVLGRRQPFVRLGKIRVLRQGIRLGDVVKKRFEPHHHFYMAAVHQPLLRHVRELDLAQSEQFLKGHPLPDPARGFICLRYQGFPLGFGKGDGNWIKNRYPKGLRQMGR